MQKQQQTKTIRNTLLTAQLGKLMVTDVVIDVITMGSGVVGGRHLHPCPVVGIITEGTAIFQIEGEKEQLLHAGATFYEPKDVVILKFGNGSATEPLTFIACYLLDGAQEKIIML